MGAEPGQGPASEWRHHLAKGAWDPLWDSSPRISRMLAEAKHPSMSSSAFRNAGACTQFLRVAELHRMCGHHLGHFFQVLPDFLEHLLFGRGTDFFVRFALAEIAGKRLLTDDVRAR